MNAVHYDEEQLIELFERGEQAVARDPHVRACRTCADTVTSIAQFSESLKSPDVWEGPELSPDPNPQVLATLRAAQQRMRTEDEQAEAQVKELLAGPRESWMPRLQEHPEWRTAGMVRKLIASTDRAIETMPPDALEIANLAVRIAEGLESAIYGSAEVEALRIGALRERGFGLFCTSNYSDALIALQRAETATADHTSIDFGRLLMLRALIMCDIENFPAALAAAREAGAIFVARLIPEKAIAAKQTEAIVLYRLKRFHEAIGIYRELEENCGERRLRAGLQQNIALCYRELQQFEVAERYFVSCLSEFEALRMPINATKTRWHFGRVLIAQAKYAAAIEVLLKVREELASAEMSHDAAIVTVDVAHAMLLLRRSSEVAELCRQAIAFFTTSQLSASEAALSALSLLKEAAATGVLSEETLHVAREGLRVPSRRHLYLDT